MSTYAEKLKDPRWQKKRLKVLERDSWECTSCGGKEDTLHVHHLKYAKSSNPWDSKLSDLETLCEPCHTYKTGRKKLRDNIISQIKYMDDDYNLDTVDDVLSWLKIADPEFSMFIDDCGKVFGKIYALGIKAGNKDG